jgi:hypothetical protein
LEQAQDERDSGVHATEDEPEEKQLTVNSARLTQYNGMLKPTIISLEERDRRYARRTYREQKIAVTQRAAEA